MLDHNNTYPVDSTTRTCCGGIGGHTHTCRPRRLDDAVNLIDLVRTDVNQVIRDLPDDAPMWVVVDVVNALWNLRNASLDSSATQ